MIAVSDTVVVPREHLEGLRSQVEWLAGINRAHLDSIESIQKALRGEPLPNALDGPDSPWPAAAAVAARLAEDKAKIEALLAEQKVVASSVLFGLSMLREYCFDQRLRDLIDACIEAFVPLRKWMK
mgnify:FL=1